MGAYRSSNTDDRLKNIVQVISLFPAILNLASNAHINTNATCGEKGPEMFCKLVEHVPGRPLRNAQCRVCDHNSANPKEQHPISNAIDGTNNWWQSPSIQNGREYHWVTITLDLRQVFQVAYIIIKAANAPRPGNWILERSLDGVEFRPWQYYAISDTECLTRYNVTPRLGPPTYKRDDEVICTSYYSRLVPLEHGEIHTSLINGRPSADDPSPTLLEFTSARYIRLRLQRIRTLNADLMTLSHHDPKELDPIVTRRYYYSVKDISVGGMCICYGHARSCPLDEITKKLQCQCEHNTCGESCNECCPGYHQNPWRPGTISAGNKCEKCNCHNKAEDCYYNQGVADQNRSINIHGQFLGGGVCINCTQHTTGINCEICADGYYRPHKISPYEDNPCHPCDCDPFGSLSSDCMKDDDHSDLQHGQCQCKEGYSGEKCDRCAFGYQGYPSCVHCNCSLVGSINDDPCTEPCLCKENVEGENCDRCKPGFYNLQERNPQGCTECFCFGVSDVCDSLAWPISQVSDMTGWLVTDLVTEKSVPPQQGHFDGPHQISINNTAAVKILKSTYYWSAPESYLGNKVSSQSKKTLTFISYSCCISCLSGYYRVGGILFGGICQPCECNGHATECDIHGVCFACQHNTTGLSCDQCLPGFYGTPSRGMPEDCQPCACPLRNDANNFSPTCHLDNKGEVICDKCLPGYAGSRCERCANGYFGNPLVPGQSCVPCDCNGNIDPTEDGNCDALTGKCLKCTGNTQGHHCEKCAEGYYGDAVIAKNCHVCECHVNSSLSNICHHETGLCHCKTNVIGPRCDTCSNGYYGLNTGFGCLPCNCSQYGSISEDCNDEGQCYCIPGVTGEKCDRCAHGFYAFQDGGCTPCDCAHTQNTCNEDSGQCICPPHTQGPKCELCEDRYWGLDPEHGCKACNCSDVGSTSLQCDLQTGQCQCKDEFGGEDCSRCALGYRDYPDCVFCDCDLSGTKADKCDESQGVCSCEEETGICSCKEYVFGLHCSECKTGTFALQASNPLGCTPCFCSGLSAFCSELEDHITLTPDQSILHVVSQSNLTGTIEGIFSQFSDVLLDATTVRQHLKTEPFYWRLPVQFQGDQLMAYGGKLKYSVAFYALDGFGTANFEPQILIKGGHISKLVIYVDIAAPQNGIRSEEEVEMKEHVWKYFNSVSDQSVTRSDFMSVLSNVEYILIKASYGQGLQQSRIANISMEIAVKAEEMHLGRDTAHLIEQCECPTGYIGLSCQSCALGYYRMKHVDLNVNEARQLIAPCVPCQCNNHSETCDLETGMCLNCRDNTAGEHCSVCAPGYYGEVTGSANDCSPCASTLSPSSFSPTCVLKDGHDFHCDACLTGYEGQYCERCSLGYYGNPEVPGGSCQECQCNPNGSIHNNCDRVSGQCLCKQGVTGQLCDACEPRHILVENECVSCDDDCTGVLLNDLDHLGKAICSINLTGVTFAPYGILADVENATKYLKLVRQSFGNPVFNYSFLKKTAIFSFLYLFTVCSPFIRAAERLLLRVQKEYHKPQQELEELKKGASHLLSNHNIRLQEAQNLVNEARTNTNETNRLLFLIYSNLEDLNVRLYILHSASAEWQVKEVEAQANLLFDRLKPLKMLEENLSRNLSEIKELISQARKQAASIKVAISADRDCIRAYQAQISSSNYNTLTLNVKTPEPENLLFYLGSSSNSDFMAVEMRRGKVAFLWDLGSGSTRLEYPDFQIDNNKWHRIHVTRFGKTGTLSIEETSSNKKSLTKTATTPGTATVLDVNKSTRIFVGGLGGQLKKSPALKVTHFKGCIGEASLNGKSIGLWNYIEREGSCNGCFGSPQDEDTSFHFDGSGYSVVERALRSTVTQIIIFFSTFSPNGLLLDFLSLELVDGKVRVTVDLGSGPLILTTENRYNNGTWYKISFNRNKKKGLNSRTYVGCIKNLEISRSTFDLLKNSYGVRKGCTLEVLNSGTSIGVSILNDGYIELLPKSLSPESELMATFATKNSSGIILAGLSKGVEKRRRRQPFFSIMLLDGHLAVHINAGDRASTRKVILQPANGTYSDGQEHSVILIRNKRYILSQSAAESNLLKEPILPVTSHLCVSVKWYYFLIVETIDYAFKDACALVLLTIIFSLKGGFVSPQNKDLKHVLFLLPRLSVQLKLRTYASSGLIYYLAHQNQMDYAVLQLHGGQLYFSFDLGKGKAVAFHPVSVSDGKWHTVAVNALGDGNTLDVEGKLYLGGLPLDYTARNIGNVTQSIPACIGSVMVNNKQLDKEHPVSIFAVNKCYARAQQGTFFDGSGFAAFVKEGYKVRADVNITLAFRTTSMNGVLLGISSAKVDAIGLEIVLFHVNNGAGRITATYEPTGANSLCDGKWHKLQANKSKHHIALMIDGNLVQTDNPHTQSTSADTNNPIFVGGYPADMKQNCLTSKSPFHGCLRNLMLIKGQQVESYDFSEAFDLRGVFPHSCPGAEH
uniref:Laminin subunit alpha-2 n=1 Tax=Pelusios castaneus TaxID=367368 RepID=A0A8C8SLQ1_9SAUR